MKRDGYGADYETFRDSVRTFLNREVKPGWDKCIEAKQHPARPSTSAPSA